MEITKELLEQRLAGLEAQAQKLRADLIANEGAKQLANHLLDMLKKVVVEAEEVILEDGKSLVDKLEGK